MCHRHAARWAPALAALASLSSACSDVVSPTQEAPEEITELPRALSASETEIIGASNRFAFDLAHQVSEPGTGFFISPLSASLALGMAMNGADGATFDQMRSMLGFEGLSEEEIDASYRSLIDLLLNLDPTVEMAIGSSVWLHQGFPVLPSFLRTVGDYFDAAARTLDFSDPSAAGVINGWVDDATHGRIADIVPDPIPSDVVMYLINAIYFNGDWTQQFERGRTADADFHLEEGGTVRVPLMEREADEAGLRRGDGFWAADLPYGGRAFSMTVLLPDPDRDVDSLLESLDADVWDALTDGLGAPYEFHLFLPRFEMDYERVLNGDLQALGTVDAFDDTAADFTRLSSVPVFISEVKQKAFVKVDEEGTEAAAVTSVGFTPTSISEPPVIRVDRPFLFVIRERLSGTILFMGKVVDPTT